MTWTLGLKTDPIETRFSYPWLFQILREEGVRHVQLGTFFELYQLPDGFFRELRDQAQAADITISSVFTAHRELGGWFRPETGFVDVARTNLRRLIHIGGLLGAESVGFNAGAVLRDRRPDLASGLRIFQREFADALKVAKDCNVGTLTLEPMSTWAEPPTLPADISRMGQECAAMHEADPTGTAQFGYCVDVAHGYLNESGKVVHDHWDLIQATLPWLHELHLKNTDARYHSTFGFGPGTEHGIIDIGALRDFFRLHRADMRNPHPIAYLEIGGPKIGRDNTDPHLEAELRASLRAIATWPETAPNVAPVSGGPSATFLPSLMCADPLRLGEAVKRWEALGITAFHLDIMDGHFVPNLPLGLEAVRALRCATKATLDVHLMVDDNDAFVDRCIDLRVDRIAVHWESLRHPDRTLTRIRDAGIQAGLALNPGTPLTVLDYLEDRIDYLLLMTVNPGFAGQALVPSAIQKIADARQRFSGPIMVDGNVSFAHIPAMVAAGANELVAGTSSLFASDDWGRNLQRAVEAARQGRPLV